ncbi:hypothetical protein MTO96_041019 [Rhipicephalus appendiculatus]
MTPAAPLPHTQSASSSKQSKRRRCRASVFMLFSARRQLRRPFGRRISISAFLARLASGVRLKRKRERHVAFIPNAWFFRSQRHHQLPESAREPPLTGRL